MLLEGTILWEPLVIRRQAQQAGGHQIDIAFQPRCGICSLAGCPGYTARCLQ